jgi:hypothetical protein
MSSVNEQRARGGVKGVARVRVGALSSELERERREVNATTSESTRASRRIPVKMEVRSAR